MDQKTAGVAKKTTDHTHTTKDENLYISNYSENYAYLDEQIYRDCSHNERCLSCIHWNGFICNAKHAVCDYHSE